MKTLGYLVLSLISFAVLGCSNDSESDLTNPVSGDVTYSGTVKAIVDQNCIECHRQPPINGAPMPLLTYDNVKDAVLTRGLVARISSTDPTFLMPYGRTRLPQAKINQIIAWRDANFPE